MRPLKSKIVKLSVSMKNRSRAEIMARILQSATDYGGITKTRISYRAFLSKHQTDDYISYMIKNGLLELYSPKLYKTTEKGWQFIVAQEKLSQYLKQPNS